MFLVVLLNLLVKPFYIIGIDAEVQNRVGEEIYGNYFSLLNFSFLLNILLDLGLTNYNTRNIAQHPHLITKHFYKILSLRFILFFLYAATTLSAAFFVGYGEDEFFLLVILMLNQFLIAIVQFCRSNFAGLHLFKTDSLISVMDRTLLIVFCSVLLWTNVFDGELKIEWFVYAQTISYGLTALVALILLLRRTGKLRINVQRVFSLAILKQSFPYALLILLMMLYSRIDAVMLERLLPDGDFQAGLYAQGFRLLDAVSMFALLFAGLLLPIFARLIKNNESVYEMVEMAFRMLFAISVVVGLTCFFMKDSIIEWRYDNYTKTSALTFGILIMSFIPIALGYVFGTLLTANGSLKYLNGMAIFGLLLNIGLNFFFIQKWQAVGAATATLVTQSLTVLVQLILAYRIFKFQVNWKLFAGFVSLVGGMILVHQLTDSTLSQQTGLQLLILLMTGVAITFAAGLFKLSDLKMVFSSAQSVSEDEEGET